MNLSAYDSIEDYLDKSKSWVYVKRKELISREIKYRRYFTIGKRFDKGSDSYRYFLILLDNKPEYRQYGRVKRDSYGRIKVDLRSLWDITSLYDITSDTNINIIYTEHTADGDIYELDI